MRTEHLLRALLEENTNLALHVLRAMEIDPARVHRDLEQRIPAGAGPEADDDPRRFDAHAANALELTVTEATSLGHNYVGCEHLLLGLVTEPDGVAGQVLRGLGAEPRLVRRAVLAALAGFVHLRAQSGSPGDSEQALASALRKELRPLNARIARLEEHLGLDARD